MSTLPQLLTDLLDAAAARGMTNDDIGRVCGVHAKSVSRWRGGKQRASVADVQPLADHLGVRLTKPRGK